MQHLLAEVQTDLVEVLEVDLRVDAFEFGESRFEIRQIVYI